MHGRHLSWAPRCRSGAGRSCRRCNDLTDRQGDDDGQDRRGRERDARRRHAGAGRADEDTRRRLPARRLGPPVRRRGHGRDDGQGHERAPGRCSSAAAPTSSSSASGRSRPTEPVHRGAQPHAASTSPRARWPSRCPGRTRSLLDGDAAAAVAALKRDVDGRPGRARQRRPGAVACRGTAWSTRTRCRSTRSCSAPGTSCSPRAGRVRHVELVEAVPTTTGVIIATYRPPPSDRRMKQYLLSVYQPDGDPPPPEVLEPIMADLGALNEEMQAAGAWVFAGGLHPPSTATVVRDRDGETLLDRRPVHRGQGAPRRLHDHRRRPTSTRRWRGPRKAGPRRRPLPIEVAAAASGELMRRQSSGSSGRSTAARSPSWSASSATSTSPRRRSRTRSPRPCSAGRRTACRPARPAGSSRPPATGRSTGCAARPTRADRHAAGARWLHAPDEPDRGRGGPRARRPAAADLHLLPPGARARPRRSR